MVMPMPIMNNDRLVNSSHDADEVPGATEDQISSHLLAAGRMPMVFPP